jgi:predicted dehydrogenase
VYGEKPLALSTSEGREVLAAASAAGVRVGCAPDTVLGTGTQTARRCLDEGAIGTPVAATAFMVTPGHERWHPDPEFYYRPGGGPLFDMGPYYLSSLVTLLGPVRRVTGLASSPRASRVVGSGPRAGTEFPVEVATHVAGVLEHENGAVTTLMMSFDVWAANLPRVEVYGTHGSLSVPDPNGFDGEVRLYTPGAEWQPVAPNAGYRNAGRGTGVADMAEALSTNTEHRASGALAYHVLDIMESLLKAAETTRTQEVKSTTPPPPPVR